MTTAGRGSPAARRSRRRVRGPRCDADVVEHARHRNRRRRLLETPAATRGRIAARPTPAPRRCRRVTIFLRREYSWRHGVGMASSTGAGCRSCAGRRTSRGERLLHVWPCGSRRRSRRSCAPARSRPCSSARSCLPIGSTVRTRLHCSHGFCRRRPRAEAVRFGIVIIRRCGSRCRRRPTRAKIRSGSSGDAGVRTISLPQASRPSAVILRRCETATLARHPSEMCWR